MKIYQSFVSFLLHKELSERSSTEENVLNINFSKSTACYAGDSNLTTVNNEDR